jgi:hypothetical protein
MATYTDRTDITIIEKRHFCLFINQALFIQKGLFWYNKVARKEQTDVVGIFFKKNGLLNFRSPNSLFQFVAVVL